MDSRAPATRVAGAPLRRGPAELPRTATHTHGGVPVLTLTRSVGESIRIGEDIEVYVVEVRGGTVRLGFKAPREVTIHREEVYRQITEARSLAAEVAADAHGALAAFAPGTDRSDQHNVPRPDPIHSNNSSNRPPQ